MKNITRVIVMFLLIGVAFPAFADDFSASVDNTNVNAGEGFTLHLSLTNAQAKGGPDTSPLHGLFTITSQGQSTNTVIINNNVTNTVSWDLTLIPKTEGQVTIPSLSIETSKGTLKTDPITLDVGHASAALPASKSRNVTITAHASTLAPYKNQTLLYMVKIMARGDVTDLGLSDLSIDNAVIEKQGKPEITDAVEDGEPVKIIRIRYVVTPLASGKITIPPMTLSGKILDTQTARFNDPFAQDFDDPFAMMNTMDIFNGFGRLKPFTLASNEVTLDVKPEAAAMDPWLPLTSLTLKEDWDNAQTPRVGEPLTRKLTLTAEGAGGKQLPDLENQQNRTDFSVYADKPVTSERISGNDVIGERVENFSLIPKKAGKLELPAIKVAWWNLKTGQVEYAQLPARMLDVLPAAGEVTPAVPATGTDHTTTAAPQPQAVREPAATSPAMQDMLRKEPPVVYAVIGFLLLVLLGVVAWAVRLQGRLKSLRQPAGDRNASIPELTQPAHSSLSAKDISAIKTAQELARFMRGYASEHHGVRKNASLDEALLALAPQDGPQRELAQGIIKILSGTLYAGKKVDLETLKNACRELLISPRPSHENAITPAEKLPKLNHG